MESRALHALRLPSRNSQSWSPIAIRSIQFDKHHVEARLVEALSDPSLSLTHDASPTVLRFLFSARNVRQGPLCWTGPPQYVASRTCIRNLDDCRGLVYCGNGCQQLTSQFQRGYKSRNLTLSNRSDVLRFFSRPSCPLYPKCRWWNLCR